MQFYARFVNHLQEVLPSDRPQKDKSVFRTYLT